MLIVKCTEIRKFYSWNFYRASQFSSCAHQFIENKKLIKRWDSERELFYDDIRHTLQSTIALRQNYGTNMGHSDIVAMCCNVISSSVIFAVLDLRVGGCRL